MKAQYNQDLTDHKTWFEEQREKDKAEMKAKMRASLQQFILQRQAATSSSHTLGNKPGFLLTLTSRVLSREGEIHRRLFSRTLQG